MRPRGGLPLLSVVIIVVLGFLSLNAYVLHRMRTVYAPFAIARARWYDAAGQAHELLDYIGHWQNLAKENQDLKDQLRQATVNEASVQALQSQNDFLQKSLGLKTSLDKNVIPAGLFNVSLTPTGYAALVNKGSRDGVSAGSPVISASGVLVGRIQAVFPSSAQVMLVSDPAFSVTVRVLNGSASGIARGALSNGLNLDLIVQTDQISEGDTLVSTGNDSTPAGLVVGTVSNVQTNTTQLFKKVSVTPAADLFSAAVIIIQP